MRDGGTVPDKKLSFNILFVCARERERERFSEKGRIEIGDSSVTHVYEGIGDHFQRWKCSGDVIMA